MFFAEFETDKYIRENFFQDYEYKGVMVEVGAGPTIVYSMSRHFRNFGWRCVCIDPNPKFVEAHKLENNEIYQFACSNEEKKSKFKIVNSNLNNDINGISYSALEIKYQMPGYSIQEIDVDVIKLDTLLNNLSINKVDLLSVDTEGWEIEVMEGFDCEKFNPTIILLENYTHNPQYVEYMEKKGYILDKTIEYNYIFKKK